jgi:predicted ArsR family transcriptional regulator
VSPADVGNRFFETTRGRVVSLLRRGTRTVDELAEALGLTDNAVRAHLATLERDGLVRQEGVRRGSGAGKPATLYGVHPDAERQFSRAYAPVLEAMVAEVAEHLPGDEGDELMRGAARRLADAVGRPSGGDVAARVAAVAALLDSWGGAVDVERSQDTLVIVGSGGCPLSAVTAKNALACRAVEALVEELTGAPVSECCERGERPRCRFEVRTRSPTDAKRGGKGSAS